MDENCRSRELFFQPGQARGEAFVGVCVADLVGRKELFGQLIDQAVDPVDDRLQLLGLEEARDDDEPVLVELTKLGSGKCHGENLTGLR